MANPGYVRSTDGVDTDNGSTWALANATLAGAIADAVAGDTIYVSNNHAESGTVAVVLAFPGTVASPNKVVCVNDSAEPPTALALTGSFEIAGAPNLTIQGCAYFYGMTFKVGVNTSSGNVVSIASNDGDVQTYENCTFQLNTTGSNAEPRLGPTGTNAEARVEFRQVVFRLGGTAQVIRLAAAYVTWRGGSIDNTSAALVDLFQIGSNGACVFDFYGLDLSALATTTNLFTVANGIPRGVIRCCKLPANWTGTLVDAMNPGGRIEMHNCDSGDTNYKLWIEDYFGSIRDETTVVRTGGASDGTTPLAYKMTSNANTEYPHQCLFSQEIAVWSELVNGSIRVELEVVTDGITLTNEDFAIEVFLSTDQLSPLYGIGSTKRAYFASAASYPTSSATWTTTGLASPVKQRVSAPSPSTSYAIRNKGWVIVRALLYRPNTTVYICPKLIVT